MKTCEWLCGISRILTPVFFLHIPVKKTSSNGIDSILFYSQHVTLAVLDDPWWNRFSVSLLVSHDFNLRVSFVTKVLDLDIWLPNVSTFLYRCKMFCDVVTEVECNQKKHSTLPPPFIFSVSFFWRYRSIDSSSSWSDLFFLSWAPEVT